MKLNAITTVFAGAASAGILALTFSLSIGAVRVSASEARNGQLHVTKECSMYAHEAGGHCTITSSNLGEIHVDILNPANSTKVYYVQQALIVPGLLDSNVVLDAGNGNRALGRCTLDFSSLSGLCTFSDGTGEFAGFSARVNVSHLGGVYWSWDGTYSFSPLPPR